MSTLQALELARRYHGKTVVHNVSLQLARGRIVGLLGPNGAGKSTTFRMIAGLLRPHQGRILLGTRDITALPLHRRARLGLGYLPQEASIFRGLSAAQNLLAVLELQPGLRRAEREEKCRTLLEEFALSRLHDTRGTHLSGGERRRVELARLLCNNPSFLLLDEPFAGVDPIAVADLKERILGLREQGIGILLTDHNVREALQICDSACIVNEGAVLTRGTPEEILAHETVRQVYLGEHFSL